MIDIKLNELSTVHKNRYVSHVRYQRRSVTSFIERYCSTIHEMLALLIRKETFIYNMYTCYEYFKIEN